MASFRNLCFSAGSPSALRGASGKVWRQSSSSELRPEWECYCHLVCGARDAAKNPAVQELPGASGLGCWDFTAAAWVQSLPSIYKPCGAPKKNKILQCTKQSPQLIITKSCGSPL